MTNEEDPGYYSTYVHIQQKKNCQYFNDFLKFIEGSHSIINILCTLSIINFCTPWVVTGSYLHN